MLAGIERNPIVVGAYQHGKGICPMLAAHRAGGRTDHPGFAKAWDGYSGTTRARRATERELRTLRTMLEASLEHDEYGSLAEAAAELREARRRSTPDLVAELKKREQSRWARVFRRRDRRLLKHLEELEQLSTKH